MHSVHTQRSAAGNALAGVAAGGEACRAAASEAAMGGWASARPSATPASATLAGPAPRRMEVVRGSRWWTR
jgi:hypothetical protein